jgi:hypothetical protein
VNDCGFVKIDTVKAVLHLQVENDFNLHAFHIYCPVSEKFGMRDLNVMLLSICEV